MKQVCLLCERTAPDGRNLYCQEPDCPAEMSPTILDCGEWLGDIEIIKPIVVLRSAVLYEAVHHKKKVCLKVAHPGAENKARLKREAEYLKDLQFAPVAPELKRYKKCLPTLVPPYVNTSLETTVIGKTMLKEHLLYFYMFEYFEGEPLRDILVKNPQLWINHVGWIMVSLSGTIALLQNRGLYHCGLCPEVALVRFDDNFVAPRVLLFDLGIASERAGFDENWYPQFVPPAYTVPELMHSAQPTHTADVYGLGLILYEMLIGEPTFTYKLRSDAEVYAAVQRSQRVRMNRVEDVETVAKITVQAVNSQADKRPPHAKALVEQLLERFGEVPEEKKPFWSRLTQV